MNGIGQDNTSTHKFVAYDTLDQNRVWNGSEYEVWDDANFATYGITATRMGTSTGYISTPPANMVRYELWFWTGTLGTSYPVDRGSAGNVEGAGGGGDREYIIKEQNIGVRP